MANQTFKINSASFQDFEVSASLRAGPGITVDFTKAAIVTGSFSGRGDNLTNVSASYIVPNQNTSASYSTTASFASNATSASFATSASWSPNPNSSFAFAGLTSLPVITDASASNQIYISSATVGIFPDSTGTGVVQSYTLAPATFSLNQNSSNYIYVTSSAGAATYSITTDPTIINSINILAVAVVFRSENEDAHWIINDTTGNALANKIVSRLYNTEYIARQNGFSLSETGSRNILVSEGTFWIAAAQFTEGNFDSRLSASNEIHFYYNSASVITQSAIFPTQYNNSQYDNGTNLSTISSSYYAVNFVWRLLGSQADTDIALMLGNQYAALIDAKNASIPSTLPPEIQSLGLLVGRIIVQSGSNTAASIDSAFSTQFVTTPVTDHESLTGLQGGTVGQHEHLSTSEYTGTGTGVFVRQTGGNLTASLQGTSSLAITASSALQSISSSFATIAATANSISFVPIAATSASWVSASAKITTADTASYILAANVNGKVSTATTADTASYVAGANVVGTVTSASFASVAATANSISFVPVAATSASWVSASAFITTAQTASFVTASNVSGKVSTAGTADTANSISFVPVAAASASWVSASAFITTAQTASYISSSATFDNKVYNHTASFATSASFAISASNARSSSYSISASNSVSASYSISASNSVSASYALSSSNSITSSYALTASFLNDYVYAVMSGSNSTNGSIAPMTSTPLAFSMSAGETWVCEAYITAQSNNNRGMRYAISSSAALGTGVIEGQILGNTNALTGFTSARITTVNTQIATSLHTQANTPGLDRIHFSVINPTTATIMSIAIGVTNNADTATVFAGSYLIAQRVR